MRPGISLAQAVSLVAVMAAGSALVDNGTIEIGTLSAAALYLVQLFNPVATLLEQTDQMQRSTASFARLVGVTQLPADRPDGQVSEPPARSTTAVGVHVDDVVFGYDAGTLVLDGINLDIAPGERLAIVGPSGAGKTTLGKIIAGLLHTSRGGVEVGGVVVDELEPHARARVVAMVAQEGHVFGRSVIENVRLGRPDATEHDVRAALDAVDALAWADTLPEGLETRIGFGHQPVSTTRASSSRWLASCASIPRSWCSTRRPRSSTRSPPRAPSATCTPRSASAPSSRSCTGSTWPSAPTGSSCSRKAGSSPAVTTPS